MKKKVVKKTVTKSATSSPQLIKELIALGVTTYKTPELEFTVLPQVVYEKTAPKRSLKESEQEVEEVDLDEKAFQIVYGQKKVANDTNN